MFPNDKISENRSRKPRFNPVIYIPGLFFVVLGLTVVFAPRVFLLLLATILLTIGAGLCFLGWKFLQLRRKMQNLAQTFEDQVRSDPRFSEYEKQFNSKQRSTTFGGAKVVSSYTVRSSGQSDDSDSDGDADYETTKSRDKDGNITYH